MKIKKYNIIVMLIISIIALLSAPSYAAENCLLDNYTQIDIKENIDNGRFGSIEHTTELIDYIYTKNDRVINYVLLRDDNYHRNYVITYNLDGEEKNRIDLGSNYNSNGQFYELENDNGILLFTSYTYSKEKYNSIVYLDNDGNCKQIYNDSSSSNKLGSNKIIAEDDEYVYFAAVNTSPCFYVYYISKEKLNNKQLSVTSKCFSPTSAKDTFYLYTNGKKIYVVYEYYRKKKNNLMYLIEYNNSIQYLPLDYASRYNIWQYSDTKRIDSINFFENYLIINSSSEKYLFDTTNRMITEYSYDTLIESNLILNEKKSLLLDDNYKKLVWCLKNIEFYYNTESNKLKIKTENDEADIICTNNELNVENHNDFLIIKLVDKNIIIDENLNIKIIDTNGQIIKIGNNIVILYSNNLYSNCYKVYEDESSYEIYKINDISINEIDEIIYCGSNGIKIEGKIELKNKDKMQVSIGNIIKDAEIDGTNFNVYFSPDELNEGVYDGFKINLISNNNKNYYFDELPLGATFYYDDILYTKIDSNLGYEKYVDSHYSLLRREVAALDSLTLDKYLTEEELLKYKDYIYDEGKYVYWLASINAATSKQVIKIKAKNKNYTAYSRYKKEIALNEKFRLNSNDGIYYCDNENIRNNNEIDKKIVVSYEECNNPKCYIEYDESKKYFNLIIEKENNINEKVYLNYITSNIDENKTETEIINNEQFTNEDDCYIYKKSFYEEGIYNFEIYTFNLFDNKSKTINLNAILDFTAPEIIKVEYENIYSYKGIEYSNKDEITANIYFKDLGASNYDCIEKYIYKYSIPIINGCINNLELKDDFGNSIIFELNKTFLIDNEKPLVYADFYNYDEYVEIKLEAKDNLKNDKILYSINESEFFLYDNKIKLMKKDYKNIIAFKYYAIDMVGNTSNIYEKNIDMNLKPTLNILNDKAITFDLNSLPKIKYNGFDMNEDEMTICISLEDKILEKKIIYPYQENILNLEDYFNEIFDMEYNKEYLLNFTLSDNSLESTENVSIKKINSSPQILIKTKELNFKEMTQIDIECYDLDGDTVYYSICNSNKEILTGTINNGFNSIFLKDLLNYGDNKLYFKFYDGTNKVKINKIINVKNENLMNEKNILIKLKDTYEDEFIDFLIKKYNESDMCIINFENDNDSIKYVFKNVEEIYNDKDILNNKYIFLRGIIDQSAMDYILNYENNDTIYTTVNENININQIELFDIENDYSNYNEREGKNRLVFVQYDAKELENVKMKNNNSEIYLYEENERNNFNIELLDAGEYTVTLNEYDYIYYNDIDYSKKCEDEKILIKAHNSPECSIQCDVERNNDNIDISVKKYAYDKDYSSKNNGISKCQLKIINLKTLDCVYSSDNNYEEEKVSLNSNFEYEVVYTVWDYGFDGNAEEFVLSNSCKYMIVHDPCDPYGKFEYDLENENNIDYLYAYDNAENIFINKEIFFNDMFANEDNQSCDFTYDENEIKELAVKNENTYQIENIMKIKNNYNREFEYSKILDLIKLEVLNNTKLDYDMNDGFSQIDDININIEIINQIRDGDLYLLLNNEIKMNSNSNNYDCLVDKNYIRNKLVRKNDFSEIDFDIYIYSSRDNSCLGIKSFSIKYYANEEITDFEIIKIYDEKIKMSDNISYKSMPVGDIEKGYAFEYEIKTQGMANDEYKIIIDVQYYYLDKNKNIVNKIDLLKKEKQKLIKYECPVFYNDICIGTNYRIQLDENNKTKIGDFEVWKGINFIPMDSIVLADNNIKKDGYILMCFDIKAYKDDNLIYSFNENKWDEIGMTAIYYANKSILEDISDFKIY